MTRKIIAALLLAGAVGCGSGGTVSLGGGSGSGPTGKALTAAAQAAANQFIGYSLAGANAPVAGNVAVALTASQHTTDNGDGTYDTQVQVQTLTGAVWNCDLTWSVGGTPTATIGPQDAINDCTQNG